MQFSANLNYDDNLQFRQISRKQRSVNENNTTTHLSRNADTGTKVTDVVFSGEVVEVKNWSFLRVS